MFFDPAVIKTVSIIALVLFILMMVAGIVITVAGFQFIDSSTGLMDIAAQDVSADDPGAGWLFLGRLFGGITANFFSAFVAVVGIICIIGGMIVYLPAFIAFIVYKATKNVTAYWILMGIWLAFALIGLVTFVFG